MKLYFIFTKKGLAVIFILVVMFLIIIGQFSTVNLNYIDGSTNQKRMEYFSSLGLDVNETAVLEKQTIIPQKLSGVFLDYSNILKESGFNISDHLGKNATYYCYSLKNEPQKSINILVVEDKIIAGDITDNLSGEITSLTRIK
jgi:hypothetical protein